MKAKNYLSIAIVISSLLLCATFFLPLWVIEIWAPQYPEGLSMQIWLDKITGDVRNINILNHYIGMKAIDANSFAEFQLFPKIIGGVAGLGVLFGLSKKRFLQYGWVTLALILSAVGLYDFYRWEYDFGHNLNPDAAIKVEGMAYQPPLLGVREILNISAWSLPGWGGYLLLLGLAVSSVAVVLDLKFNKKLT